MSETSPTRQRRSRGRAWHWQQTDSWYFTPPGTKRRVRLFDESGRPIRGIENRQLAELALARVKAAGNWRPEARSPVENPWIVAKVCSHYIQHCERRAAQGKITVEYRDEISRYLNDFCQYAGALSVAELRKGHVEHWCECHPTWRSRVSHRNAITAVLAAFRHAWEMYDVPNPIRGMKKPPPNPRLISMSPEDELLLYDATKLPFRNFLFAAIHTGLRPFCELAKLKCDDVFETDRGMMWRVYSSKTKKTRRIPIRSEVAELTRELMTTSHSSTDSVLFLNQNNQPWTKAMGVNRFLRLKKKLGWDQDSEQTRYSCYICRHTFAHRMLAGYWNDGEGCSIEVLAELMGDTPKVTFDHYGREWGQHYQDPLWEAIGVA